MTKTSLLDLGKGLYTIAAPWFVLVFVWTWGLHIAVLAWAGILAAALLIAIGQIIGESK